jgi:UDP-N-acetylglucosamine 2-epimerase (non-hydrolysing)
MKKKILLFYGTRPEFIKLYPIIKILREINSIDLKVVNTGQHKEMVLNLEFFFKCKADIYLDIMTPNQSLNELLGNILSKSVKLFLDYCPQAIIVQGDTTTVFGAATAAFYQGIKVFHVEAGLRSFDINSPFPEEFNRRSVSLITNSHFAPTQNSVENLINEGIHPDNIFLTGNTVIDTLKEVKMQLSDSQNSSKRQIFITAHRRENQNGGIENVCRAVISLLEQRDDLIFKWAVHPNPKVFDVINRILSDVPNVILLQPLNYLDLLNELNNSHIIWTDSGGIQEEAPEFNKPLLILREETERPEIVESGIAKLVGTKTQLIIDETFLLLDDHSYYDSIRFIKNPFGDGNASQRIVEKIIELI